MAAALWHPGPYHVLAYGLLLGSQVFNSFVGGIVAFRALPRPSFSQLQSALFPKYFALQTLLALGLGLTYPGAPGGEPPASPAASLALLAGARADLLWVGGTAAMGALNWSLLGPMTTRCMRERKHQETRDGRKSYDAPPHSDAMQRLNRRFAKLHGYSSLANLLAIIATVVYGVGLGGRIV